MVMQANQEGSVDANVQTAVQEGPPPGAQTLTGAPSGSTAVPAASPSGLDGLNGFGGIQFTPEQLEQMQAFQEEQGGESSVHTVPEASQGDGGAQTTSSGNGTQEPVNVKQTIEANLTDPTSQLAAQGLQQEAIHLTPEGDEFLDPTAFNMDATTIGPVTTATVVSAQVAHLPPAEQAQAAADVLAQDYELSLLSPEEMAQNLARLQDEEPMQAASMTDEMNTLLDGMENGEIPLWAKPAVTKVEQQLAARGLSASSIGRDALFNSIIQSAMPIAQQNAAFKQDANKTNYTAKVQAIFADVSAENAAKHFNASSENQKNQFMSGLKAQLDSQNAARKDAMSQFNTAQTNDFAKTQASFQQQVNITNAQAANQANIANAQMANQASQFQAQLDAGREQFNAQQSAAIEQSNVTWRRQTNQINTAIDNQVSQTNTQNAFNLSNQALSQLWQETRDEAQWAFQADESALDRRNRLEANVIANETAAASEVGAFAANITDGLNVLDKVLGFMN